MLINNFKKAVLICTGLLFTILTIPTVTQAQSTDYQPFTFGLKGGLNVATFYGDAVDNAELVPLFNGGIYANYRFSRHFSVQVEALYSSRGAETDNSLTDTNTGTTEYQLGYISVPVLLKYHFANSSDWTPNIYVGPQIGFLVYGEADDVEIDDQLKDVTFGIAGGIGVDWNVATSPQDFVQTIGLDLRYTLGLTDVFDTPGGNIDARNSVFSAALTVGF